MKLNLLILLENLLKAVKIIHKTIDIFYQLNFQYDLMSKIMRIIKKYSIPIQHQKLEKNCEITIAIKKSNVKKLTEIFNSIHQLEIKELETKFY